jgi:hypothetical protein
LAYLSGTLPASGSNGSADGHQYRSRLAGALQGHGLRKRLSDNNLERNKLLLPPKAEWGWWYQYYFATERGRAGFDVNRRDLAKLNWKFNSPKWDFDDATFDRTAASFDNPDYVGIVIHNYRWRLSLAEGDPQYDDLEKRLAEGPVIAAPTITLDGDFRWRGAVPTSRIQGRHTGIVMGTGPAQRVRAAIPSPRG